MAEIAAKVAASTPSDPSIRPLDRHAGASIPERTFDPEATNHPLADTRQFDAGQQLKEGGAVLISKSTSMKSTSFLVRE
jgi:hypothetical protein